jgi:adenylate cyclase
MVYIDSAAKRNLGQPTDPPLDRRFHAKLLKRLGEDGAKLILYDLLFDQPSPDENSDKEFGAAIRENGRVVLVTDYTKELQANFLTDGPVPAIPILNEAAAGSGLAKLEYDPGRCLRRIDPGTESYPSATWVAAGMLRAAVTQAPAHRLDLRWMNYYCPPIQLRAVNFDRALSAEDQPRGYFKDKIVVVGQSDNPSDTFATPYTRFGSGLRFNGPVAPGAAIQAMSLLNLVRGDWLTRLSLGEELAVVVIWGTVSSILLMLLRPWFAIGAAVFMGGLLTGGSILLPIYKHVWFAWAIPVVAQTPMALIWGVGYQYIVEARRSRQIRRAFGLYLSPYMAERIADRDFDLSLGGKEVEATVMFTDLAGFTTMSEPLSPTEVSTMLTSYFTRTSKAIKDLNNGTLIKYLGDGVMAAWGAPEPDPKHAEHTVLAALTIIRAGKEPKDGPVLRTRIGINTGVFLAGNLGSEDRFDYTLFGDATNFASRLEGLNKYLGTDILISEATFQQLKDGIQTRPVGRFIVVGKGKPAAVYEVLGWSTEFQPAPPWFETFARGLGHFAKHELDAAEKMFRDTIEQRQGNDGPSEFYLQRIERERTKPDTSVWDGTVRLEGK